MKRLKFLSVIMIIVTLFLLFSKTNTFAATYKIDNYLSLNTTYVDEIICSNYNETSRDGDFYKYALVYKELMSYSDTNPESDTGYIVERKRMIIGENSTNYIKTQALFRCLRGFPSLQFSLFYNETVRFKFVMHRNNYYKITINDPINFNDPTKEEFENCAKVKLGPATTRVLRAFDNDQVLPDSNQFLEYEDVVYVRNYNVLETINIKNNVNFLPSKEELLNREVKTNGLTLENTTNEYYGGDYNLDEYGLIDEGMHYLKILLIFENKKHMVIYEIEALGVLSKIPSIYTTTERQVSEEEILDQVYKTGLEEFVVNTDDYYKKYNKIGKYYVEVKFIYKHKEYVADLFIYVTDIGDNKFKLLDDSALTIGYKEELDLSNLNELFDFTYFYLDEYTLDDSMYIINKDIPGEYPIHIKAIAKNNEIYIQTYYVKVIDNEKPIINITSDTKLEYSYIDSIDIDSIINTLDIIDISNYEVDYNVDSFINNLNKPGLYPLLIIVKDEFLNESTKELELNIIDDVKPKLVLNDIYVNKGNKLEEQFIKSNIYAYDEIDGKLNNDNIVINDINGYKYNYDIPGIYKFEVSAKDNMQNEAYGSFNIIVNKDEIEESKDNKIIKLNRNNRLTQNELLLYLIDRNYISADIEYEIVSDYFNDEILKDEYSLVLKNGEELSNFEIQIIDSDINYEKANEDIKINNTNNITLIITLAIIASLITIGIILVIIIYKKRH